jgi:uncharacterized membrane protein
MLTLVLGLILFLGVHSVPIFAPAGRASVIARHGEGAYKALFSITSAIGLIILVIGYGLARQDPVVLWEPPTFTRHISALLMIFVFPLLFAAYMPGRIKAAVKHPMLAAVKIWAFAHLIANGTLADLILFGAFLAWAVVDRISVKRRSTAPAVVVGSTRNDVLAVVLGLAVYLLFTFYLHEWLIGVPPFG